MFNGLNDKTLNELIEDRNVLEEMIYEHRFNCKPEEDINALQAVLKRIEDCIIEIKGIIKYSIPTEEKIEDLLNAIDNTDGSEEDSIEEIEDLLLAFDRENRTDYYCSFESCCYCLIDEFYEAVCEEIDSLKKSGSKTEEKIEELFSRIEDSYLSGDLEEMDETLEELNIENNIELPLSKYWFILQDYLDFLEKHILDMYENNKKELYASITLKNKKK